MAGTGVSNFTTFADGTGIGATAYDFLVSGAGVESTFIAGLLGPITDLHFTSSQVLPPGTSTTSAFHTGVPSNAADIYPTTAATNGLLLKIDGSNTFTTSVPEPESYAMMLVGLAVGVAISLLQALTQIQEQTLAFVPKIILMFAALILMLPFMSDALAGYMTRVAARIASGG